MQISLSNHCPNFERRGQRPEWNEDQARWEASLRRQSARRTIQAMPNLPVLESAIFAPARTRLEITRRVTRRDALILPRALPAFEGQAHEDLMCGGCDAVIGSRISLRLARRAHPEGDRLIVRCLCGTNNLLSRECSKARHGRR